MSDVPVWRLFAYMDSDPNGERDHKRVCADWQLEDAIRWARFRGYDHVYLTRTGEVTRFDHSDGHVNIRHHMHTQKHGDHQPPAEPEGGAAA